MNSVFPRIAALFCVIALLPGCSVLFVETVPDDYATRPQFTCTTNVVAPALDTVATLGIGLTGFLTVTLAGVFSGIEGEDRNLTPLILAFALPAAVTAGSAVYGFYETAACNAAIDQRNARYGGAPMLVTQTCAYDTQCPGSQVCQAGRCVEPSNAPATPVR